MARVTQDTRPRHLRRASAVAVLVGLSGAALSGCGVAGTDFRPGVAAEIGSATVTVNEVDDLTVSACSAFVDQLASANQVVPLSYLRSAVAQNLVLDDAVRQFGEEYDVSPGQAYDAEVQQLRSSASTLGSSELRAVELLQGTNALVGDVLGQVGAGLVGNDAAATGAVDPTSDEAQQAGSTAFSDWLEDHEATINPVFGITLTSEGITQTDTSVSFPLSDAATTGLAADPDPQATMDLPPTQRCGSFSGSQG